MCCFLINKLIFVSKTSFISGKSRVGEVSFNQILDVQSLPQTYFLGKPLHTLFYLSLPRCFLACFETNFTLHGRCVFVDQESADREKVIPEKRKKLYGVSWSLRELSDSFTRLASSPVISHAPCIATSHDLGPQMVV